MKRYRNLAGNAGVRAYNTNDSSIDVRFKDGSTYTYTESDLGEKTIGRMKQRAASGKGLATLISRNPEIRHGFTRRGAK